MENKVNLKFDKKYILCKICKKTYTKNEFEGLDVSECVIYCEGCKAFNPFYNFEKSDSQSQEDSKQSQKKPETMTLEKKLSTTLVREAKNTIEKLLDIQGQLSILNTLINRIQAKQEGLESNPDRLRRHKDAIKKMDTLDMERDKLKHYVFEILDSFQ